MRRVSPTAARIGEQGHLGIRPRCTRQIEKDSLFGQLLDSDFGDGNTDSKGFVIRGGYTVARNWTVNATLFLNELSNDVPQTVTVFNDDHPGPDGQHVITDCF